MRLAQLHLHYYSTETCSASNVDNLYQASCVHEQNLRKMGKVNVYGYYGQQKVMLMGRAERFEAHLSKFFCEF